MDANYLFVDGSALAAQVRQIWRAATPLAGKRLHLQSLVYHFMHEEHVDLHAGNFKRATFYFPSGDEDSVDRHFVRPDFRKPGEVRDVFIKFCGQKLKKSAKFDAFVSDNVPAEFHSRFQKSEKGIDIEICCDAFRLAAAGRLERLFLLTNDDDFVPLCRMLKEYGANVSLFHLSDLVSANSSLLQEVDSYDVVPNELIKSMFAHGSAESEGTSTTVADILTSASSKPDAEPSDLAEAISENEVLDGAASTPTDKAKS